MIEQFRHKGLKRFYETGNRSKLPPDMVDRIQQILTLLTAASDPAGPDIPHYDSMNLKAIAGEHGPSRPGQTGALRSGLRMDMRVTSISLILTRGANHDDEKPASSRMHRPDGD